MKFLGLVTVLVLLSACARDHRLDRREDRREDRRSETQTLQPGDLARAPYIGQKLGRG